jgi:hypothetical protein
MIRQKYSLLILLALALSFVSFQGCSQNGGEVMTKEKMEQVLKNDLPVGTPMGKVASYLDSKKIDYVTDSQGKKIEAMARNIDKGFIVSTSLRIVFDFDETGKLTGFTTEKKFTGP